MNVAITNGTVQIDEQDLTLISGRTWHLSSTGYAVWRGVKDGKKQTIRMHRLITNAPDGLMVDHINHDRLDNRRSNLRICTQSENMRNLRDQGKGYWYQKQNKNWVVEIWGRHIGCFSTEAEAKSIAAHIRAGGTYTKPERKHCKYGHELTDAYDYGQGKRCKECQSRRSREYYIRRNK
jgi:hypothetical protein